MSKFFLYIRLIRPHFLVGAALLYFLGAGAAKFLGSTIDWGLYLLGQFWITSIQLSTHLLNEYFDYSSDQANTNRTPFSGGSGALGPGKLSRNTALWLAITCLTAAASITVLIIRLATPDAALVFVLGVIFLGAFFYSTPPIRLVNSGYGELTTSIIVANLVPTVAFLLQNDELHRLVAMTTFPLTPLHISMMLTLELPDYLNDLKYEKMNLLVRLGWQRGMTIHNYMILTAYLILGIAAILGLPLAITLAGFLSLPLGIFQIWLMNRIADGMKPNWNAITFSAISLFGITAYLLSFTLWTR